MPRALKIRPDCIPTIKSTLLRNGFPSQRILAEHLEIAQSTVSSFLNGKPVDYLNFLELCRVLGQEWQDIADLEGQTSSETAAIAKATVAICADAPNVATASLSQQRFAIAFSPNLRELAMQQGSKTVALSLQLANQRVFCNSDTFLQWFCASVSLELGLLDSEQLAKYWKLAEMIGTNQSCKAFFEQYLLPELSTPLTLGLDEVDRVFSSLEIADDFFGLLRALHEEAKRREIWKNFRLIVVHSTEVYIPLDINKSPFNVGLPVELPEFTSAQVQELARRYRLDWAMEQVQQLMEVVGGHPYLVRLAMYAIARQDITLNELLQSAPTESGIYSDHLRRHLGNLKHHPTLLEAFREVISSQSSVRLPSEQAFKLSSIGLVKLDKNEVTPRCHLYRQYFQGLNGI
jgi:hypothetical protein